MMDGATRLERLLETENAALNRLDVAAVAALVTEKQDAMAGLPAQGVPLDQAARLQALAAENTRLLERAILVQGRILAMVARAARQAPTAARYGARGAAVPDGGALAMIRQA